MASDSSNALGLGRDPIRISDPPETLPQTRSEIPGLFQVQGQIRDRRGYPNRRFLGVVTISEIRLVGLGRIFRSGFTTA
jgi:hypothetical protein